MNARPNAEQEKAIAAQERQGVPWKRTKVEAKDEAARLAEATGLRASTVHQTTWMEAEGDAYALHLDSRDDGYRVAVHRWYSTGDVVVTALFGSFWRPRQNREGVEYGRAVVRPDERTILAAVEEMAEYARAAKAAR